MNMGIWSSLMRLNLPEPGRPVDDRNKTRMSEMREERNREFGHRIVAAAIVDDGGQVWSLPAPARHGDVMRFAGSQGAKPIWPPDKQGFLTSTGKFVTRYQAHSIALRWGQIDTP